MDLEKLKAIKEWTTLRNIHEVRIFHGLASFYKKFIRNFSHRCAPIVDTIKKEQQPFKWIVINDKEFELLKEKITE